MQFTTSDKINIHYSVAGAGKSIIFIHGWSMDSSVFCLQHDELIDHQVISIDLRGHGLSSRVDVMDCSYQRMAADIVELIAHLKLEKPILAGWSMGVSIIFAGLEKFLSLCSGFVFMGGTPTFIASDDFKCGMRKVVAKRLQKNVKVSFKETMTGFYQLIHFAESIDEPKKARLDQLFTNILDKAHHGIVLDTLEQLYINDYRVKLSLIDIPTLIICGEIDKICSLESSKYMASQIKGSRLEIVDGTGHMAFFTQDEICNNRIDQFVKGLS